MQYQLIEEFLERNAKLINMILSNTIENKHVSVEAVKMAKNLSHVSNVLTAIHLYRLNNSLDHVLAQMPREHRMGLEQKLTTIWGHISVLSPMELSELAKRVQSMIIEQERLGYFHPNHSIETELDPTDIYQQTLSAKYL